MRPIMSPAINKTASPAIPPNTPSAMASGLIACWALVTTPQRCGASAADRAARKRRHPCGFLVHQRGWHAPCNLQGVPGVVGAAGSEFEVRAGDSRTTADPSVSMSSSTTVLLNTTTPTNLTVATK